jgi:predicted phage terminase large subunit-like protein
MELLLNDDKFKNRKIDVINLPALNEKDESNFEYDYGVGFSTDYYRMRRASFERNNDMASWEAQYMGKPIERSGALFDPADMKYYNGTLPDETPVRIFMAVDPAFGGGDFVAAPICYQYEDGRVFVHDVVYSDADKKITKPLIVSKIIFHKVQAADFEVTKSTAAYKEVIEEALKEKGHKLNITSHSAPTNVAKEIRIRDKAPEIREMYYIESGKRSKEYELFMQNVFSFSITGRNKHDDAPDSLAQAVDMIRGVRVAVIELGNRPF